MPKNNKAVGVDSLSEELTSGYSLAMEPLVQLVLPCVWRLHLCLIIGRILLLSPWIMREIERMTAKLIGGLDC